MIPQYLIDQILSHDDFPVPCEDPQPETRNYEISVIRAKLAIREQFPEVTRCDWYLFSEEEADRLGIDGICERFECTRPVIGCNASCFSDGTDKNYQAFLILHEAAHLVQDLDDCDESGSLAHGEFFQKTLSDMLKLYNEKTGSHVTDYDQSRSDGKARRLKH